MIDHHSYPRFTHDSASHSDIKAFIRLVVLKPTNDSDQLEPVMTPLEFTFGMVIALLSFLGFALTVVIVFLGSNRTKDVALQLVRSIASVLKKLL